MVVCARVEGVNIKSKKSKQGKVFFGYFAFRLQGWSHGLFMVEREPRINTRTIAFMPTTPPPHLDGLAIGRLAHARGPHDELAAAPHVIGLGGPSFPHGDEPPWPSQATRKEASKP